MEYLAPLTADVDGEPVSLPGLTSTISAGSRYLLQYSLSRLARSIWESASMDAIDAVA